MQSRFKDGKCWGLGVQKQKLLPHDPFERRFLLLGALPAIGLLRLLAS